MIFDFTDSIQIINNIDSIENDYIAYIEINSDIEELENLEIKSCFSNKKDLLKTNFSSINNNNLIIGTYDNQNQIGKLFIPKNKITNFALINNKNNIYLITNISSKLNNNKKIKGTFILNKFESFYEPKFYYDGNLTKNEPEKNYNLYLKDNDNYLLLEITNLNNIDISFYDFNNDKNIGIEIISEEIVFDKKYFIIQTNLKKIKLNIKLKNENNLIENYLFKYETSESNSFKLLKNINKIEKKINLQFNDNKNIKYLFNSIDNNEFSNIFSYLYIYAYQKDENKPEKLNNYLVKYKIKNDENDLNVQINLNYDNNLNYVAIINSKVQDNSNNVNYLFENEAVIYEEKKNFKKELEKYRLYIIIAICSLLIIIILCCCCKKKKNNNGFAQLGEENTFENNNNKNKYKSNNNKLEMTGSSNNNSNSNSFN